MKFTFLFGGRERAALFQGGIEDYVDRIRRSFAAEMLSGKKEGEISRFLKLLPRGNYLIGLAGGEGRILHQRPLPIFSKGSWSVGQKRSSF